MYYSFDDASQSLIITVEEFTGFIIYVTSNHFFPKASGIKYLFTVVHLSSYKS